MNVSQMVKVARFVKGMSQAEVAKAIGISTPTYQRFENELGGMRVHQLERLAEVLDIDAAAILVSRRSTDSSLAATEDTPAR